MTVTRAVLCLVVALGLLMLASLHLGLRVYSPATVWAALGGAEGTDALIVTSLRVPRTLVAAVAGAPLALSGFLMQAVSRNPLAEPGLLGVNAGAAFAVSLGVVSFGVSGLAEIAGAALIGALATTFFVFSLAAFAGPGGQAHTVLLAGVTTAAMLAAFTQVLLLIDETALETLLFWLSGGFADRGLDLLLIGMPVLMVGLPVALALAPALDALRADDTSAAALGVAVTRVRVVALSLAAVLAGGAVAMAGPVVFLGLVAPHLARRLPIRTGQTMGSAQLALLAALVGATLAITADIVARLIIAPQEAPISAVLALVGVPVLIGLLRRGAGARA